MTRTANLAGDRWGDGTIIMRAVVLSYAGRDESVDFPDECVTARFDGPALNPTMVGVSVLAAIRTPVGCPPLSRSVVPGDSIVVGYSPGPAAAVALETVVLELRAAQVGAIAVVSPLPVDEALKKRAGDVEWAVHQPADRESLGYLAATKAGRRVYLNQRLTLADAVVLIAETGFDEQGRVVGPWSLLDADLSDLDALRHHRTAIDPPEPGSEAADEVAWLLGNPFQVGIVPGVRATAGWGAEAVGRLRADLESAWTYRVDDRADLVIAGIGSADRPTTWSDLARGLAAASGLVRRGGRIVVLSDLAEPVGPALSRRIAAEFDRGRSTGSELKGRETDADWPAARTILKAAEWADLFLMSELDPELVEGLGIMPIESPKQAARLAREARSCVVLAHADLSRGVSAEPGADPR